METPKLATEGLEGSALGFEFYGPERKEVVGASL